MTAKTAIPRVNRGFSFLQLAIVLGIVMLAAPLGMERYSNYLEEQSWMVTAEHLSNVSQGARRYIKDNYNTLQSQVKNGTPITITGQTLRDQGYLPNGFALTNNTSQTYVLAVARNPTQTDKMV
ncbi:shufflon system plasmid conjugative transfer pilus tip adhesin PilV, partial [Yersinia enterocolitica]|uniref:shufflon system plasmid conjugative transfer pilus tip adhesin PilV n=2 Tax=Yersinia TaxID=629 RepID=UPI003AB758DE